MKTTLTLLLLTISVCSFSQTQQTYEYLSMTQYYDVIELNKDAESFETISVKGEIEKGGYDFKPLLKRIQQYEEQGWELVSNNVYSTGTGTLPRNYVLMRRKK